MYPVLEKERMLYLTPEGGTVFVGNLPLQKVNPTGAHILELCTGKYTCEDICIMLAERYDDEVPRVTGIVTQFLEESRKRGNVKFCEEEPSEHPLICGNKELWVPYYVSAELTKKCDLRCVHCYAEAGPPDVDELSTERWFDILDEFCNLGTLTVNLTGGDPLAHPDFFNVLDFCEGKFHVIVSTSGYRIDEDTARKLSHYTCIETIQVSLDGPDPKTHNAIRGKKDSFERAVTAIQLLSDLETEIHIAMVVLPLNEDKIEETILLAKQLGADVFGAGKIYSMGRAKGKYPLSVEKMIALDKKVTELSQKYSDETFVVRRRDPNVLPHSGEDMSPNDIILYGDALIKAVGGNCGAGYRSLFIQSDGNVIPCGMLDFSLGNVAEMSVTDVLKTPAIQAFRELSAPHTEICGECSHRFLCSGCHALAYIYSETIPHCKWREMYEECIPCTE